MGATGLSSLASSNPRGLSEGSLMLKREERELYEQVLSDWGSNDIGDTPGRKSMEEI